MMNALTLDQNISIKEVLNTPDETEDIISVCDRLIISLKDAQKNAEDMLVRLNEFRTYNEK
jgi:hypothetical protein